MSLAPSSQLCGFETDASDFQRRRNAAYAMLHPDPRRRITTMDMLRSEWMNSVSVCEAGEKGL